MLEGVGYPVVMAVGSNVLEPGSHGVPYFRVRVPSGPISLSQGPIGSQVPVPVKPKAPSGPKTLGGTLEPQAPSPRFQYPLGAQDLGKVLCVVWG